MFTPYPQYLLSFLKTNKQLIVFVLLMSVFRSAVADWYTVPTGSMKPTIQEGDRIIVNKMAYDLRVPFTDISVFSLDTPKRGEIIVFDSKAADLRLIKRVIGLPGDIVAMSNDQVIINGQLIQSHSNKNKTSDEHPSINDNLVKSGDIIHRISFDKTIKNQLSSFSPVSVPPGHYLVLGDNRQHSSDSRVYGFVPHKELKGKAISIAFSFDYNNFYIPRKNRFFKDIYGS